jgi:hypothetical protein
MPQSYAEQFEAMRGKYFAPLLRTLQLSHPIDRIEGAYAVSSAAAGNVRVFFESERGLCGFGVGEVAAPAAMCDLESLAERFPRVRIMPEGHQRLGLDEQAAFIEAHWQDLQVMFSPEHIRETKAWRQAAVADHIKKLTRDT